jgi:hypothetical protein
MALDGTAHRLVCIRRECNMYHGKQKKAKTVQCHNMRILAPCGCSRKTQPSQATAEQAFTRLPRGTRAGRLSPYSGPDGPTTGHGASGAANRPYDQGPLILPA